VKFLTLFQNLKNILFRLKKKKPSLNFLDTQRDWKQSEIVGICVGHSRIGDHGAFSYDWLNSEWSYNREVGRALQRCLDSKGIPNKLYTCYNAKSYPAAMRYIKSQLKEHNATLAVELHFNAYDGKVRGTETWYRYGAPKSKKLASSIQSAVLNAYGSRNRGIKGAKKGHNGYSFLNKADIPTALCEPFFGDNKEDFELFSKPEELGQVLADGINNFLLDKHESNQSARKDNASE